MSENSETEIDLTALLSLLFARKLAILLITTLSTLFGVAFAVLSTPIYSADALVQLEEKSGGGLAVSADLADMLGGAAPQSVAEIEILRSRMILAEVVNDLHLDWHAEPRRLPLIGNFLTRVTLPDPGWSLLGRFAWQKERITLAALKVPPAYLGKPLTLTAKGGGAFTVELEGLVLNGRVGEVLQTDGFTLLVQTLNGAAGRQFILQQDHMADVLKDLRDVLYIGEKGKKSSILRLAVKDENANRAARILDQILKVYVRQNLFRNAAEADSSLSFIEQQIPVAQATVRQAEGKLNAYKLSQDSVDLSFETLSMLEQTVEIETQLNALSLQEQELQKRFTQNHPAYKTLLEKRAQLQDRLSEIRGKTGALPETQLEMLRLSLDLEVAQETYLQLVSRAQELQVIKAGTLANIRVIDQAMADPEAITPNKKLLVVLSFIMGLVVSLGYIVARAFVSRGIETTAEIEGLGLPVYATIPKVGNGQYGGSNRHGPLNILAKSEPTNLAVEALRSLRTSLHFGMLEATNSVLMITSSRPGEGKSFLSVNLATVVAQAGQNVCLVDTDIRRGYLRRFFGVEKTALGLTDVLAGDASIEDVIMQDTDSGLYFIPAGRYPPNPSELLMHQNFADVIRYLDDRFDITILDTPPLLAVTDPAIIGKYAGMVLLAAKHHLTNIAEVKASLKTAETSGLKIAGAVLNVYDSKKAKGAYGAASYHYEYKPRDA